MPAVRILTHPRPGSPGLPPTGTNPMPFQNETPSDGRTVKNTLEHLICKHLPSAAVASGWVGEVDFSKVVADLSQRFPLDTRPENLGLTALREWLTEQEVDLPEGVARLVRKEWMRERMCEASKAMGPIKLWGAK
jgi:hypothetical protein